jgi:uncharacterized protein YcbK (DUF882 family)
LSDDAKARRAGVRGLVRRALRIQPLALALLAALATLGFLEKREAPFSAVARRQPVMAMPLAEPSEQAFGRSGAVQVRMALPGASVEYPLQLTGDPTSLSYEWVRISDAATIGVPRPLAGDTLAAPDEPGFYRLALVRDGARQILDELTVAVMLPFEEKRGATIDGYTIGTYLAEMVGGARRDRPDGFVKITPDEARLRITKHLRLADFLPEDGQSIWPRYAAMSPRVLDKLELVLEQLSRWRGDSTRVQLLVDVHSGYRPPAYNRVVRNAAKDSRHQYGDAVDVTIDADGDGRYTLADARLVVRAVDAVETQFPDLVGGMGLYTSRRFRHPYVHIDARGERARWRG